MPLDTGLVIQYLALGLGLTGVVLSLSYPHSIAQKIRDVIRSSKKEGEIARQEVVAANSRIDQTLVSLNGIDGKLQKVVRNMQDLYESVEYTNGRIDKLSKEMIAANYSIKKGYKEMSDLSSAVKSLKTDVRNLSKSKNKLETQLAKLDKVTLWTEKNVKQLNKRVKKSENNSRNRNRNKKKKANGKHRRISMKHAIDNGYTNGNGIGKTSSNGNGKPTRDNQLKETVLVQEKTN